MAAFPPLARSCFFTSNCSLLLPLLLVCFVQGSRVSKSKTDFFPPSYQAEIACPFCPLQLTIESFRESSQGPCVAVPWSSLVSCTNSELGCSGAPISLLPQHMFCCEQRICCKESYRWTNTWSFAQWTLFWFSLLLLELHIANHIWEKIVYFLSNCKIT